MPRLFLLFLACTGCRSCGAPPGSTADSGTTDSDTPTDTVDTAETGETGDTGPPPMCPQLEVEPNDHDVDAQVIDTNWWACGHFYDEAENDWDYLAFDFDPGDGISDTWIEIDVDAANRASVADPEMIVYGPGEDAYLVEDFDRETDPFVVFPVSDAGTWVFAPYDKYAGNSTDHAWYARVLQGKQPLEWDTEETEPNDELGSAEMVDLADGERAYGVVEDRYDLDWYTFTPQEGQANITARILANNYGSPLDARLAVYNSAGTLLEPASTGLGDSYDKDPLVSVPLDLERHPVYYFSVRVETDESTQVGGSAYWYVLEFEVTDEDLSG